MYNLVAYLIEEKYCNNELEAVKILESISDEFYEEVSAAMRLKSMRNRMENLIKQLIKDPTNSEVQRKIKTIRGAIPQQETISKAERVIKTAKGAKGIAKTPRGKRGVYQQPKDVPSSVGTASGIQRTDTGKYSDAATRLTNISPGSRGSKSVDSSGPPTSVLVGGRHTDTAVSGGRGTNQARSGGLRGVKIG